MNKLFFVPANGFPAGTYTYFLSFLQSYPIHRMTQVGHGAYSPRKGWRGVTQELIDHLDQLQAGPVIGIGHSLGGVLSYWAASQRPDLFKAVILLDPPMLGPTKRAFLKFASLTGLLRYLPPASKARTRRTEFPSREEALQYFSGKSLFKQVHPQCLEDYVNHGLVARADGQGFTLAFKAEVEYQFFYHTPYRLGLKRLEVPSYFVHSNTEQVLSLSNLSWLQKHMPGTSFIPVSGGHLFPLELPEETASTLKTLIESL